MILLAYLGLVQNNFVGIIVGIMAPALGYLISEIIIGFKISKRVDKTEFKITPRDKEKESKLIRLMISVTPLICAFIIGLI